MLLAFNRELFQVAYKRVFLTRLERVLLQRRSLTRLGRVLLQRILLFGYVHFPGVISGVPTPTFHSKAHQRVLGRA